MHPPDCLSVSSERAALWCAHENAVSRAARDSVRGVNHPICVDCTIQTGPDPAERDHVACDGCGLIVNITDDEQPRQYAAREIGHIHFVQKGADLSLTHLGQEKTHTPVSAMQSSDAPTTVSAIRNIMVEEGPTTVSAIYCE
jgi:hypothetical protein